MQFAGRGCHFLLSNLIVPETRPLQRIDFVDVRLDCSLSRRLFASAATARRYLTCELPQGGTLRSEIDLTDHFVDDRLNGLRNAPRPDGPSFRGSSALTRRSSRNRLISL
jgi:hypothetical protein